MLTARRTYEMLENQSLWKTAAHVHELLTQESLPHAIVGGVAVCLHGYRRNTVDLDLLVNPSDSPLLRIALETGGYAFDVAAREFTSASGVAVQFVMAGDREGPGQEAVFPDPADPYAVMLIEDLPVLTLAQLIQSKLACGLGSLRRTHKDFADVVELIAIHDLGQSFAKNLHRSVRAEFKALMRHALG